MSGWLRRNAKAPQYQDPLDHEAAVAMKRLSRARLLKEMKRDEGGDLKMAEDHFLKPVLGAVGQRVGEVLTREPVPVDPSDEAVKKLTNAAVISKLTQPPAQSGTEMVGVLAEVTKVHQGLAQNALSLAEQERQRRQEAEEDAAAQAQAARLDEREKAQQEITFQKTMMDQITALQLAIAADRHERDNEKYEDLLSRLEKTANKAIEEVTKAGQERIAAKEREFQWEREKWHLERQVEALQNAVPRAATPEDTVKMAWAEAEAAKFKQLPKLEAQKAADQEKTHEAIRKFLTEDLGQYLRPILGIPAPGNTLPGGAPPPPEDFEPAPYTPFDPVKGEPV